MGANWRDFYLTAPRTLNAKFHRDFRWIYALTYLGISDCVTMDDRKSDFCQAFPKVDTICRLYKLSRASVFRALTWLEAEGYIYHKRRYRQASLYTIVVQRQLFLEIRARHGQKAAERAYEERLLQVREEAQSKPRYGVRSARRQPDSHPPVEVKDGRSRVSPEILSEVSPDRRLSPETHTKIQQLGRPISNGHQGSGFKPPERHPSHKESERQLPHSLAEALPAVVKRIPPAAMTEAERQARWQELQRQRAQLLAEAGAKVAPK